MLQRQLRLRFSYVLADYISVSVAWFVFTIIRFLNLDFDYEIHFKEFLCMDMVPVGLVVFPIGMSALYWMSGYYEDVFLKSRLDDVLNAAVTALFGTIIIYFAALFNDAVPDRMTNYELVAVLWLLLTVFPSVPRVFLSTATARHIRSGAVTFNTLIIGNDDDIAGFTSTIASSLRKVGRKIVGHISPDFSISAIKDLCEQKNIQTFIIAPGLAPEQVLTIVNALFPLEKSVYITPGSYDMITSRPRTSMVGGEPFIDITRSRIPAATANLKRLGDITVASVALLLLLPVFAVMAIIIKRQSPGPVIYRQTRIGRHKRPFNILKFRSMRVDAETNGPSLSTVDDPRVTPVGRFMRKYRIDELPQFWNVLRGDMSLVGPRPEREFYIRRILERAPYYSLIHQVRPGITSWGMVKYGYASSVEQMIERMKYDLLYIENLSFGVDIKIIFYTFNTVITGKGV